MFVERIFLWLIMALSKLQTSMQWQKLNVNWLKEGDANSKKIHGVMASRKRTNSIFFLYWLMEFLLKMSNLCVKQYFNIFINILNGFLRRGLT